MQKQFDQVNRELEEAKSALDGTVDHCNEELENCKAEILRLQEKYQRMVETYDEALLDKNSFEEEELEDARMVKEYMQLKKDNRSEIKAQDDSRTIEENIQMKKDNRPDGDAEESEDARIIKEYIQLKKDNPSGCPVLLKKCEDELAAAIQAITELEARPDAPTRTEYERQIAALRVELEEATESLTQAVTALEDATRERDQARLTAQNAATPAYIAEITIQRDAAQQQVEELTHELQSLRELLADAIRAEKAPEANARVQELTEEVARVQQECDEHHEALTLERQRIEDVRERSSAPSPPSSHNINPPDEEVREVGKKKIRRADRQAVERPAPRQGTRTSNRSTRNPNPAYDSESSYSLPRSRKRKSAKEDGSGKERKKR